MSQVVTIITDTSVTQVSDMRLTYQAGVNFADQTPKTLYIQCENGFYLLGTVGIGMVGRLPMHVWIAEYMSNLNGNDCFVGSSLTKLAHAIHKEEKRGPFWFVASGIKNGEPFLVHFGNMPANSSDISQRLGEPLFLERNLKNDSLPSIFVIGPNAVMTTSIRKYIRRYIKLFSCTEFYAAARFGARVIRQSSAVVSGGNTISPSCLCLSIEFNRPELLHFIPAPSRCDLTEKCPAIPQVFCGKGYMLMDVTLKGAHDFTATANALPSKLVLDQNGNPVQGTYKEGDLILKMVLKPHNSISE